MTRGASAVSRRLADNIGSLVIELLPQGCREGHEWRCGSVRGEPGQSLGVHLAGDKAGVWSDFSTGDGGDALDLVRAIMRCDFREALGWSLRWLGLDPGDVAKPPPPTAERPKQKPVSNPDVWHRGWRESQSIAGTIAEHYLLLARRVQLPTDVDDVIRYHPNCPFGPDRRLPAMIALARDVRSNEPRAIHRTALLPDGSDRDRSVAKMMLGPMSGAAIKLSPDDTVTVGLGLTEGIETGLSVLTAGWGPIWAAGSASGIAKFPVLPGMEALTIFADADENGAGQAAARECGERWAAAGIAVTIRAPLHAGADWADPRTS